MQSLPNHTLLYDDACPLCQWYTGAFVKHGFLDESGRAQYHPDTLCQIPALDADRARHEIALWHRESGEVHYGLESLLTILGHRWPWMARVGQWRPVNFIFRKLYSLVSYNRKVIALDPRPAREQPCAPDYHAGYRWAYLILAMLFTTISVHAFAQHLIPLVPAGGVFRELAITLGMVGLQSLLLLRRHRTRIMEYLGHMLTIYIIGGLLLWPLALGAPWLAQIGLGSGFFAGWITAVVAFMAYLHARRVKALHLPTWLTFSWVLYRLIILSLITL